MKILNLENFESWPFVLLCILTISVKQNERTKLARVLSWCSSPCASACGGAPSDWSCCLCLRPPPASPPSPGWPCPLGRQGPTGCATCAETDGAKKCVWLVLFFFALANGFSERRQLTPAADVRTAWFPFTNWIWGQQRNSGPRTVSVSASACTWRLGLLFHRRMCDVGVHWLVALTPMSIVYIYCR